MFGRKKRQRRREQSGTMNARDRREFVYLDEVSVTSLLSSRLGKVPSEFTDSLTASTKAGLNSSIAASAAVLKSSIGSQLETSTTEDTKIVSKATIQTSFKKLFEIEQQYFVLTPILPSALPPAVDKVRSMVAPNARFEEHTPWSVSTDRLKRGELIEVEVELQADPAFRISTIFAAVAELANESKALQAYTNQQDVENAIELSAVLKKLMVGLIPLKCRLLDYVAVEESHGENLVHRRALAQLPSDDQPSIKEVFLVGVAEEALFWKDIRRVLFSKSQFRVLCRLNSNFLTSSWTPVKLVEILGDVAPNLEYQMEMFSSGALKNMTATAAAQREQFIEPRVGALQTFGELLAQELSIELDDDDRKHILTLSSETADLLTSVLDSRKAFTQIVDFLTPRAQQKVDPVVVAQLRTQARQQHNLLPGGSPVRMERVPVPEPVDTSNERFIDAEIISIYW